MDHFYQLAANAVLVVHFAYVAFVLFGFAAILLGLWRRHGWARNFWLRMTHLSMILFVVAETALGITCLLTTLENHLRTRAGQAVYQGDFIAEWLHGLLFFDLPAWVFTAGYFSFGAAVLATFIWAPPRWPRRTIRSGHSAS